MEKENGKYLYCAILCGEEKSFGRIGMNNSEVYNIPCMDIAAVVSDFPMIDYELTEENTNKHEDVIRQVMNEYSVVPTEFGTILRNEAILKRLLKKARNPVRDCLKMVNNMVELGVKTVLSEKNGFTDTQKKQCTSDILGSLKACSGQTVTGDLFSGRLILNASFLVNRERVEAFSEEVEKLQNKYPTLKFLYSGPWAPHNFVYIKIGTEGVEIKKK